MMTPDWSAVRAQVVMDPEVTYLNTGSYGLIPRQVQTRVEQERRRMYQNPVDFLWRTAGETLWQTRVGLARYLNVDPSRLMFTENVSVAINYVAASLRLAAPGEILIADHEYGAMHWAWERAAARAGLNLRCLTLPLDATEPGQVVDAVVGQLRPRTRLLFLSHVYYTMGLVMPLRDICAAARRRGVLTVIDGAHAPGMLPLDLTAIGADFYAANLHKWFLAPVGTGFLHVTPGNEDRIQPWQVSWGWHYDRAQPHVRNEFGNTPWLRSFEFEGSRDLVPWLAIADAQAFHEDLDIANTRRRHHDLSDHVRARLGALPPLRLITPAHADLRGGLTAFKLPTSPDPQALRRHLWEKHRIEINLVEHPAGPFLRVSTHVYNTTEEVDRLHSALRTALPAVGM